MMFLRTTHLTVIALLASMVASSAQPLLSSVAPIADPIAAADTEYGRTLRQELVRTLSAGTDASCRRSQGLDEEGLSQRLRDIYVVHGTMWNVYTGWAINSS